MIRTVLFDFDQTLVDSRALAPLREVHFWEAVAAGIPNLQLYPGVREVFDYLRAQGVAVGIVSNSPRDAYLVPACAHLGITPNVIIGYHEVTRHKPYPDPFLAALSALRGRTFANVEAQAAHFVAKGTAYWNLKDMGVPPYEVLTVGDASNDIAAMGGSYVSTVAALWGASEPDELYLARPDYICAQPADLIGLIEDLKFRTKHARRGDAWALNATAGYATRVRTWFPLDTSALAGRPFLRGGETVRHLRRRHKGNWAESVTNHHVSNFKIEMADSARAKHKREAAKLFATELASFLPIGSIYLFVPTSKRRDHAEFDHRNDWVVEELLRIRGDLRYIEPVSLIESRDKASQSEDSELRNPDVIIANYQWNAAQWPSCPAVYVIDDVLTKGGHIKATEQFVRMNAGHAVAVTCLAWAVHG